jgi:hypothetical protein
MLSQLPPCLCTRAGHFLSHAGEQRRASVLYILMLASPERYKAMVLRPLPHVLIPVVPLVPLPGACVAFYCRGEHGDKGKV